MPSCPTCHDLRPREGISPRAAFDTSVDQIDTTARQGCKPCILFWAGISRFRPRIGPLTGVSRVYGYGYDPEGDNGLRLHLFFKDSRPPFKLEFFLDVKTPRASPWLGVRKLPRVTGNPSSSQSVQWVRLQVKNCAKRHSSCNKNAGLGSLLPTRVLDIRSSGTKGVSGDVRLIETKDDQRGVYACLSHCWGGIRSLTTESATLEQRKQGIPWSLLPKTFQDVTTFLRKMGISYLWIDSLCILQDDEQDWHRESYKMASVYQNAYLTVAASQALNDMDGCFVADPNIQSDYQLFLGASESQRDASIYYVREQIQHWSGDGDPAKYPDYPLMQRGWVLQERLMSPRFLHICKRELVWECAQASLCECGEMGSGYRFKQEYSSALTKPLTSISNPPSFPQFNSFASRPLKIDTYWHSLVELYTSLKLSVPSDRLPAITGLATQLEHRHTGAYIAGMWEDTLLGDLLWRVDSAAEQPTRSPEGYQAPSFSWASLNAKVRFWKFASSFGFWRLGLSIGFQQRVLARPLCRVERVTSEPVSKANSKGQLSAGSILIEGICNIGTVDGSGREQTIKLGTRIQWETNSPIHVPSFRYYPDCHTTSVVGKDSSTIFWVPIIATKTETMGSQALDRLVASYPPISSPPSSPSSSTPSSSPSTSSAFPSPWSITYDEFASAIRIVGRILIIVLRRLPTGEYERIGFAETEEVGTKVGEADMLLHLRRRRDPKGWGDNYQEAFTKTLIGLGASELRPRTIKIV